MRSSEYIAQARGLERTAFAEINGDRVTTHNLRNCNHHTATDYQKY